MSASTPIPANELQGRLADEGSGDGTKRAARTLVPYFTLLYFLLFLLKKRTTHTMMPKRADKC